MRRQDIRSGQRVRFTDGTPSGVWTVTLADDEPIVVVGPSGHRRIAAAVDLEPELDITQHPPLLLDAETLDCEPLESDRDALARVRDQIRRVNALCDELDRDPSGVGQGIAAHIRRRIRGDV